MLRYADKLSFPRVGFYFQPPRWVDSPPAVDEQGVPEDRDDALAAVLSRTFRSRVCDAQMLITHDGLFLFHFEKLLGDDGQLSNLDVSMDPQARKHATRIMNAYLAALCYSLCPITSVGGHHDLSTQHFSLTGHDLWHEDYHRPTSDVGLGGVVASGPPFGKTKLWDTRWRYSMGEPLDFRNDRDFVYRPHSPLNTGALKMAADSLEWMLGHDQAAKLLTLWEIFGKSLQSAHDLDFDWAVASAWTCIESALEDLWSTYIAKQTYLPDNRGARRKVINHKRRERLMKSKDFTAAVKIETLSLAHIIDHDLYQALTLVRQRRNGWVHSLEHASQEESTKAFSTLIALFRIVYGFDVANDTDARWDATV